MNLITDLNLRPNETERRAVEQMFGIVVKNAQIFEIAIKPPVFDC